MRSERQKVRLSDIFYNVIKNKRLIIILTLLGFFAGIILSVLGYIRGEMTKQYKITASVAVLAQTQTGRFSTKSETPNREDFILSQDMTDAAIYVMSANNTASAVVDRLKMVGVSAKSIQSNLSLTRYNQTQIIEIALTWRSEKEGVSIVQALTEVSDDTLLNTLKVGRLSTINPPSASYIFGGNIKITTLIYATFTGLLIGILVSVLKLLVSPTLLKSGDMEALFGIEVLGAVPYNRKYGDAAPFSVLPDTVNSEIASSSNILLNRMERAGVQRLYITSSKRKEGKTRLLADLAVRISESGKRVLAVDCDFNNPTLASFFGVSDPAYSLNDVYNGDCDRSDAIIRLSGCLYLLPSVLDRRAELMGDAMMELLDSIFEEYDYVLIDTDSVGVNSEVIRLNRVVQAALFIVKFDYAELSEIRSALLQISKSGLPTAGCIVNGEKTWREVLSNIDKVVKQTNQRLGKKPRSANKKEN